MSDLQWTRKQPEVKDENGDYHFKHMFYITTGAKEIVSFEEMTAIISELRELAKEHDGIDYLQVYEKGEQIVWVIDQISKTMIEEGHYKDIDGSASFLLPSEY